MSDVIYGSLSNSGSFYFGSGVRGYITDSGSVSIEVGELKLSGSMNRLGNINVHGIEVGRVTDGRPPTIEFDRDKLLEAVQKAGSDSGSKTAVTGVAGCLGGCGCLLVLPVLALAGLLTLWSGSTDAAKMLVGPYFSAIGRLVAYLALLIGVVGIVVIVLFRGVPALLRWLCKPNIQGNRK